MQLYERILPLYSSIEKYKSNPDIFIQFSNILKFGINPNYDYTTPNAIYGYPLNLKNNTTHGSKSIFELLQNNISVLFGKRKYVHVFELVDKSKILYISRYNMHDFEKDRILLLKIFNHLSENHLIIDDDLGKLLSKILNSKPIIRAGRTHFEEIYEIINIFTSAMDGKRATNYNVIFRTIGYEGIIDDVGGIITSDIEYQALFFSKKPLKLLETLMNSGHKYVDPTKKFNDEKRTNMLHDRENKSWQELVDINDIHGAIKKYMKQNHVSNEDAKKALVDYYKSNIKNNLKN